MEKYIISVDEAIQELGGKGIAGVNEDNLRSMLRADVCSFGKAYKKQEDNEKFYYMIDRLALIRCMEGKQNFFK